MKRYILTALTGFVLVAACALTINAIRPTAGTLSSAEVKQIVSAPDKYTYIATGQTESWYNGKSVASKVEISHKRPGRHRIEYMTAPLKGVVTVDDGHCVWRFDPKLRAVIGTDDGCSKSKGALSLLISNYRVQQTGRTRIAGRRTEILDVKTKSGELKKRLWVDDKTHITLRSEDYAGEKLISRTALDSIDYDADVADSLYVKPSAKDGVNCFRGGGQAMSYGQLSKTLGFKVKVPGYITKGYKLDTYRLYKCPCQCDHQSAYIRYTSGLSSISVFETSADSGCIKKGGCSMNNGECSFHDRTAMLTSNGKSFIVIGDVSRRELAKIVNSLR